jgi:hypothetical protein
MIKPLIATWALSGTRPYLRSVIPINIHKNNNMMLLMANPLLFRSAGRERSRPATGERESIKCAAYYGSGMPDENSLDEERELCTAVSLLPY